MWLILVLIFLIIVLAISISWTRSRGAPWAPTPMSMVHKMLIMAEAGPELAESAARYLAGLYADRRDYEAAYQLVAEAPDDPRCRRAVARARRAGR